MPKQMLLHVTVTVTPENMSKFLEALRLCWVRVADEPENLLFDVFQDLGTPERFRLLEVWSVDRKWFEKVQLKKEYYVPYAQATVPMYTEDRAMEYYEREEV